MPAANVIHNPGGPRRQMHPNPIQSASNVSTRLPMAMWSAQMSAEGTSAYPLHTQVRGSPGFAKSASTTHTLSLSQPSLRTWSLSVTASPSFGVDSCQSRQESPRNLVKSADLLPFRADTRSSDDAGHHHPPIPSQYPCSSFLSILTMSYGTATAWAVAKSNAAICDRDRQKQGQGPGAYSAICVSRGQMGSDTKLLEAGNLGMQRSVLEKGSRTCALF
jgi:hypothetical protein